MICSCCKIDKEENNFRRVILKNGYKHYRNQCNFCLNTKQKERLRKKIKVQPEVLKSQIEVLEIPDGYKKCLDCNKVKYKDSFYKSKNNVLYKCCKLCYSNKFSNTIKENGGSIRVPNRPDTYTDIYQKQQTFEFLKLCGWEYTNGIWWKKGIKNEFNVWDKIEEKVKKKIIKKQRTVFYNKFNDLYEQIDDIVIKRSEGMRFEDIADIYNCSHTTIRSVYKKYEDEKGTD